MPPEMKYSKILVPILFLILCAFSVARVLSKMVLTPDSTGYLTAAQTFIDTGHMFAYANSPSWTLEVKTEPYTEQPSGFPIYLMPFLLVFKQPVYAAAAAQSFIVLIFYFAVYVLAQDLGLGPFTQAVYIIALTLFRPLQYIFVHVESETLFLVLTLWCIHFLVAAQVGRRFWSNWIAALLFAAAASLTRTIGALILAVFVWVALRRPRQRLLSVTLSILFIIGPVVAWALRNQLLYGATSMTHQVIDHLAFEKLFPQLVYLLDSMSRNAFLVTLILALIFLCFLAVVVGPLYPWIRQVALKINFTQRRLPSIVVTAFGVIVALIALAADRLGFSGDPEIGLKQISIAGLGLLVAVIPWILKTNFREYILAWKEHYDWKRWNTRSMLAITTLFLAGMSHFWGITALSLVTSFSPLQDRLLAPSLVLLLLTALAGLSYLAHWVPSRFYASSVYGVAFGLLLLSPFFLKGGLAFRVGLRIPPEQELWQQIYQLPGIDKATHFYSDYNFTHEIFGNRPQRIILDDEQIARPGFLARILAAGHCPFILVNQGSSMSQLMDQHYQEAGLTRLEMSGGAFELFAQPCLLSS
jgi:hypothetical protein